MAHFFTVAHLAAAHLSDVPAYVSDLVVLQGPAAAAESVPVTHSAEQAKVHVVIIQKSPKVFKFALGRHKYKEDGVQQDSLR